MTINCHIQILDKKYQNFCRQWTQFQALELDCQTLAFETMALPCSIVCVQLNPTHVRPWKLVSLIRRLLLFGMAGLFLVSFGIYISPLWLHTDSPIQFVPEKKDIVSFPPFYENDSITPRYCLQKDFCFSQRIMHKVLEVTKGDLQ